MEDPRHQVGLDVPRFGEFARQYVSISSRALATCLAEQHGSGQRIGRVLERAGFISTVQLFEILRRQAGWAARMRSHDIAPQRFPISTPISLCMPCFNEADVLEEILTGALAVLPEFVRDFELIIVDDGSTDNTSAIVRKLARSNDCIRLVRHDGNRGYGAAVTSGLRAARKELICFTDGDGQFNLLDLPQLLVNAQSSDVVIGYRHHRADNGIRRFNARSWNWVIRALLGLRVRDLDCAFKLFHRRVVEQLQLRASGACISAEILVQCIRGGASVSEVPVTHFPRATGKATGGKLSVVLKALRELPIVWQYRHTARWERADAGNAAMQMVTSANSKGDWGGLRNEEYAPAGDY